MYLLRSHKVGRHSSSDVRIYALFSICLGQNRLEILERPVTLLNDLASVGDFQVVKANSEILTRRNPKPLRLWQVIYIRRLIEVQNHWTIYGYVFMIGTWV